MLPGTVKLWESPRQSWGGSLDESPYAYSHPCSAAAALSSPSCVTASLTNTAIDRRKSGQ